MRLYAVLVYLFLYTPIAIIALFSFNAGRHASDKGHQQCKRPTGGVTGWLVGERLLHVSENARSSS